jgi:hypothetical protein
MKKEQRDNLKKFIENISNSPEERKAFISNPFNSIKTSLNLEITEESINLGLANSLLISILQSPETTKELTSISKDYSNKLFDLEEARRLTSQTIWNSASEDLKAKILMHRGEQYPPAPGIDPRFAMANIAVAVDIVAVLTQAVAIHSEYIFSGRSNSGQLDIQSIANILTRGE